MLAIHVLGHLYVCVAWNLLIGIFLKFKKVKKKNKVKKNTGKNRILRKIMFCPKMVKVGPKWAKNGVFCIFLKYLVFSFSLKYSEVKNHVFVYISPKAPHLSKLWFSSYGPKSS